MTSNPCNPSFLSLRNVRFHCVYIVGFSFQLLDYGCHVMFNRLTFWTSWILVYLDLQKDTRTHPHVKPKDTEPRYKQTLLPLMIARRSNVQIKYPQPPKFGVSILHRSRTWPVFSWHADSSPEEALGKSPLFLTVGFNVLTPTWSHLMCSSCLVSLAVSFLAFSLLLLSTVQIKN